MVRNSNHFWTWGFQESNGESGRENILGLRHVVNLQTNGIFVITTWMRRNLTFPWSVDPPFRRKKNLCVWEPTLWWHHVQKIWFDQKVRDKNEMKHSKTFPPQKFFDFVDVERFQKCNLDCMQKWKALQDLNAHTYSNQKTLDHNQLKTWHEMSKIAKTKQSRHWLVDQKHKHNVNDWFVIFSKAIRYSVSYQNMSCWRVSG